MMWKATATKLRPSAIMLPQLGVCAGTPTPRNDRAASISTAEAATKVACTTSGATMLGSTWRQRMTGSRVPTAWAASTNNCSRRVSASERTSRATRGISGMVMATITVVRLACVTAISAIASRMPGMAIRPSITRMMGPSVQRTKPAVRPSSTPATVASTATEIPTISETRPPQTARLNTSRPSASVPK